MARTLTDIQNSVKEEFVKNVTLRNAYELDETKTFDEQFSKVSIESIFIFIFASVLWAHENLWEHFASNIEQKIITTQVMSIPWYYDKALSFQSGMTLVWNQTRYTYEYNQVNETDKIIKYVAIRQIIEDGVSVLRFFVSKENKVSLSEDELSSFRQYLFQIGAAGIHYHVTSGNPDAIAFEMEIYYDPLVLNNTGESIEDGSKPVESSINKYLNDIEYGGEYYSTQLVDALQKTKGVKDIVLKSVKWNSKNQYQRRIDSINGAFSFDKTNSIITYNIDNYELE